MKLFALLILTIVLTACAPVTSTPAPAPTELPQATAPAAPAPTQEPTAPPVGIAPPSSGGGAIAPTRSATAVSLSVDTTRRPGWSQIVAANSPPARFDHTLTLDTSANKIVLFGGRDGSKTFGDTWIYDLRSNAWREVKAALAPEARFGHAAAFDPQSKRVLIFAGQANGFFNDVWAFDAAKETWQKIATRGNGPAARYGTSAVVDTKRNALIVSHGFASDRFDDTFALDLATLTWSQVQSLDGQPLKRCLHEAVYDARADRMILFGGCSSGYGPCPQGDLWSLDASAKDWNEVSPTGIKPSPRSNPSLVDDGAGRAILFGGKTNDGPSNDVWSLDVASGEWAALSPSGVLPAARYSHDTVWNPSTKQMFVFGGRGDSGALNDTWLFTP